MRGQIYDKFEITTKLSKKTASVFDHESHGFTRILSALIYEPKNALQHWNIGTLEHFLEKKGADKLMSALTINYYLLTINY